MAKRKYHEEVSDSEGGWIKVKKRQKSTGIPVIEFAEDAQLHEYIKLFEFQALALHLLNAGGKRPQWSIVRNVKAINQVVVLMVPGLEMGMFTGEIPIESPTERKDRMGKYLKIDEKDPYPVRLDQTKLPGPLKHLSALFLDLFVFANPIDKKGPLITRLHSPYHKMLSIKLYPDKTKGKEFREEPTGITTYLLSLDQQLENGFVVHPIWFESVEAKEAANEQRKLAHQSREDGWLDTNIDTLELDPDPDNDMDDNLLQGRRVLAIDCEFVKGDDDQNLLAHISVIDFDGNELMNKFVKPDAPIKDYVTEKSGVTEAKLRDVQTTLGDIQQLLMDLLTPKTILVGHSLESDLNVLKITHPYLIDTTQLYPHQHGLHLKQKLSWLAKRYLNREIQKDTHGHDPTEDAKATLDLVKQKLKKGPQWGTSGMFAESIFEHLERYTKPKGSDINRRGAVVDWGKPERGHGAQADVTIGCTSDAEVIQGMERAVQGLEACKDGTADHIDFVYGRLRELEIARGWWNGLRGDGSRATGDVESVRQEAMKRLGMCDSGELGDGKLGEVVSRTVDHVVQLYKSLPRGTALIVYSGTGDPREARLLLEERRLGVQDPELKAALSKAYEKAMLGVAFISAK